MVGIYIMLSVLIVLILIIGALTVTFISLLSKKQDIASQNLSETKNIIESTSTINREIMTTQANGINASVEAMQRSVSEQIGEIRSENKQTTDLMMRTTIDINSQSTESLRILNDSFNRQMQDMRTDMQKKLDEIEDTVDEQLQTNLEKKLQESFRTVSEQLIAVQRGLGEMQTLASNVGDLKKTLSNVKSRGIWGEVQLGAILSDILSPSQYDTNVITVPHTINRVEYAIKLPGNEDDVVYLPIDSKFPGDTYNKLLDAYESGSSSTVESAWRDLEKTLTSEAKDIHDKYISVPHTTEFGIMFLPVEGLYAEAVKRGMVEKLQKLYKINIAGPTTMAALLNSLQMGFKTLQIQKQSGEIWKILQSTRTEFEKYTEVLQKAQSRLKQTQDELENLVGVRTRQLHSKLSQIDQYSPDVLPSENK